MQKAADITIAAYRHVAPRIERGMRPADIAAMMKNAHEALGAQHEFALILLGEASAYPHGSGKPQAVRDGEVVLMDCGCSVEGYQSDISRTFVFGEANAEQRKVWKQMREGQRIAIETARVGVPAGAVDDAVRSQYEKWGYGPGYKLPGTSHRTGHGIGLDGHEPVNLVHGEATPLAPGMCFSATSPGSIYPGSSASGSRIASTWARRSPCGSASRRIRWTSRSAERAETQVFEQSKSGSASRAASDVFRLLRRSTCPGASSAKFFGFSRNFTLPRAYLKNSVARMAGIEASQPICRKSGETVGSAARSTIAWRIPCRPFWRCAERFSRSRSVASRSSTCSGAAAGAVAVAGAASSPYTHWRCQQHHARQQPLHLFNVYSAPQYGHLAQPVCSMGR